MTCETIDYVDDLHRLIEPHSDLVDWLTNGAFGLYLRRTLEGMGRSDSSTDERDRWRGGEDEHEPAAPDPATQAMRLGEHDTSFSYEVAGREAVGRDRSLRDLTARFSMSAGQRDQLPRFSLTTLEGDTVREVSAVPRDGVDVAPPQPWFADTPDGRQALFIARAELAKGRTVTLTGPGIGIAGGDVPTHFSDWVQPAEPSSGGELGIGLSEPLELVVTMDPPGLPPLEQKVPLYQVPPEPGAQIAYAGAIGGAVLAIDLFPIIEETGLGTIDRFECRLTVTLAVSGEGGRAAMNGLGFARAFSEVDRLHFACGRNP